MAVVRRNPDGTARLHIAAQDRPRVMAYSEWTEPLACHDCGQPRDIDVMTVCSRCLSRVIERFRRNP